MIWEKGENAVGYSNKSWACPFFSWDEKRKVHCEGGGAGFSDKGTYADYTDRYCASVQGWKQCSLAVALLEYYDRTGDESVEKANQEGRA